MNRKVLALTMLFILQQLAIVVEPQRRANRPKNANQLFLACCNAKRVDARCKSRCNFDVLNRKVLTDMFIGTDNCPISNVRQLLACAAHDSDLTACCRSKGVAQTKAGNKCLGFCQMSPRASNFQADRSMLPCWGALESIKLCFKQNLIATSTF